MSAPVWFAPSWIAGAALLLWPALWNGYPIVFADTGTYLSQAMHLYLGWDRPPAYSAAILPLHMGLSLWPVAAAQAALAAWILARASRAFAPQLPPLAPIAGVALGSWLPWTVAEIMPDLLTPLLVVSFCLLALAPEALPRGERRAMGAFAAFAIAAQQSSVPLYVGCIALAAPRLGPRRTALLSLPLGAALLGTALVNAAGHGRFAPSPFGALFPLARMLADGSARATLDARCPDAGWRLCAVRECIGDDSDEFLWAPGSPVLAAGGHKAVALEASAIILATLADRPAAAAREAWEAALSQSLRFASGDGLNPWPAQVAPWIARDFPKTERARYAAARQQRAELEVPAPLAALHRAAALGGIVLAGALLPLAIRRDRRAAWLLALSLAVLPLSAAIAGPLSGPHDRYQARIVWLPGFAAALAAANLAAAARRK